MIYFFNIYVSVNIRLLEQHSVSLFFITLQIFIMTHKIYRHIPALKLYVQNIVIRVPS